MTRIVPLSAQFRRGAEGVRNALGGALVIGGEGDPDMAVIKDALFSPYALENLVERLRDQETADAVSGLVSERAFEEVEPPQRREFIEHHQELVTPLFVVSALQALGQPAPDLIQHKANKRFGP